MNADIDQKYIAWRKAHNHEQKLRHAWRNRKATRAQVDEATNKAVEAWRALPVEHYAVRKAHHMMDIRWQS